MVKVIDLHFLLILYMVEILFRMLLCAEVTKEDFYVIHHEMGHIEYYMSYRKQPTLFQVM